MNTGNIFRLNPSLEMMSGIAVAISYWERSDVKSRIDDNFSKSKKLYYDPDKINDVNINHRNESNVISDQTGQGSNVILSAQEVVHFIFKQIDLLKYPEKLLRLIKMYVVNIGQKICYWRDYVTGVLKLDINYASKIYWTSYGEIDELKILHNFWLKDKKFPDTECPFQCFMGYNYLYCIACIYGQEDIVRSYYQEMKIKVLTHLHDSYENKKWTPYAVLATWICFCTERTQDADDGQIFFEDNAGNPLDQIPTEDLLLKCISYGFEFAVKYFWNRLTIDEKQNLVVEGAELCLKLADLTIKRRRIVRKTIDEKPPSIYIMHSAYKREVAVRMLLFLVNNMTEMQKIEFLRKKLFFVIKLLVETWPYQELCDKILDTMCDLITENHRKKLLELIIYYLNFNLKRYAKQKHPNLTKYTVKSKDPTLYFTTKKFYSNLLQIIMRKVPKQAKKEIFDLDSNYNHNLEDFYENRDYVSLSIIVNDPDFKECKERMLNLGIDHFGKFVCTGDYNNINQFIKIMAFTNEELICFKQKLNLINSLLVKGDISSADQNLNWLCDSDQERIKVKNDVDAVEICFVLIKNNKFETANKFLTWRFSKEEEKKYVKSTLTSNEFLTNKFFEIWENTNASDLKTTPADLCSKLLNWFFETDEEITNFKITQLVANERFITKYWETLCRDETLLTQDEFLKFCLPSYEIIELMKKNIANNVNWWIDTYVLEQGNFKMIYYLFNWVFNDSLSQLRNGVKNYVNSPRGALLCVKILQNYLEEKEPPKLVPRFFRNWIGKFVNFTAIKLHLDGFEESGVERVIILNIKKLLEKREKRQNLKGWFFEKTFNNEEKDSDNDFESDSQDESGFHLYSRSLLSMLDEDFN